MVIFKIRSIGIDTNDYAMYTLKILNCHLQLYIEDGENVLVVI